MSSRFLRGLATMELEERILNGGAAVALVGVLLPWIGGDWLGGDHVSYNGLGFYTGFLGFGVLLLSLAILLLTIVPLAGGPILLKKKRHRELFRLVASGLCVLLTLSALSVLMKVTIEFSRMGVRFGIYVCLVGGIGALLESLLRYLELRRGQGHETFHHPEDALVTEGHATVAPPPPPPAPPPAPPAEEHPIYP